MELAEMVVEEVWQCNVLDGLSMLDNFPLAAEEHEDEVQICICNDGNYYYHLTWHCLCNITHVGSH